MNHHAYYIEDKLARFEQYKTQLKPFWAKSFERFGIDEARALIALASLKNYSQATFLLGISSITSEAQQALLKLFEEPQEGTIFVLLLPPGALLPTLKSRMLEYPDVLKATAGTTEAKKFLKMRGKERSDYIAKMLKDDEGVKERVRELLNALEAELAGKAGESIEARAALGDIAMARNYLGDRSPSLKMLLEHLALSLPSF